MILLFFWSKFFLIISFSEKKNIILILIVKLLIIIFQCKRLKHQHIFKSSTSSEWKEKIETFEFSQSNAENNKDIILRIMRKIICDPNTRKSNEWGTNNA
jgi:hypothetical protein